DVVGSPAGLIDQQIDNSHIEAGISERDRAGAADAAGCTGDDRHLSDRIHPLSSSVNMGMVTPSSVSSQVTRRGAPIRRRSSGLPTTLVMRRVPGASGKSTRAGT